MNNLNFAVKDLRVLRDINNYFDFYNRAMDIKHKFGFKEKVIIDVVDTLSELSNILNMDVPDWVIGTSFDNVILIIDHNNWTRSNSESVDNLILHEFIHVVLNSKSNLPIWLNEGLAIYFSNQYASYKNRDLKINQEFDLYKLDYSNNDVYHISIYVLIKLINKYGIERIVEESLKTKNFEKSQIFNNCNLLRLLQDDNYTR